MSYFHIKAANIQVIWRFLRTKSLNSYINLCFRVLKWKHLIINYFDAFHLKKKIIVIMIEIYWYIETNLRNSGQTLFFISSVDPLINYTRLLFITENVIVCNLSRSYYKTELKLLCRCQCDLTNVLIPQ